MDAIYYRALARVLMEDAAKIDDPVIAARVRERAQEYLVLAQALDEKYPLPPPKQPQLKKNEDED
jgi:hypothetical protein